MADVKDAVDEGAVYTPPRVVKMSELNQGQGEAPCNPGSGVLGSCITGTGAGFNCTTGNTADDICGVGNSGTPA